jgi:protein-tyrosine phosphatase
MIGEVSMHGTFARVKKWLPAVAAALIAWVLANPVLGDEFASDRVIQLEGTTNTRDIGGYQTSDLRTIRWRQIIRSENLSRLTPDDFRKLEDIGVKTVIDLRTEREHEQAPTVWQGDNPPQFFHFPVGDSHNEWFNAQRKLMRRKSFTEEQALEHMVEGYRMIAEEGPPSFHRMLDIVLDESNWPVLIHCSAGKDRAGVATALILEALGVDRETIMADFLLTNEVGRSARKAELMAEASGETRGGRRIGRGPTAEAWYPIVGVKAEMLQAFYASVDERYGSMEAFLAELGADPDFRRTLASALTEQPKLVMGE